MKLAYFRNQKVSGSIMGEGEEKEEFYFLWK
jgi:hypothetical protein